LDELFRNDEEIRRHHLETLGEIGESSAEVHLTFEIKEDLSMMEV
jgi:hypothetical protein